ncbi:unnamed protein product [Protopolystoma xenopodis]|uniref:Uncharacterized protein n=1 Tax=Protopolystoma xenopodis TaxID=117903 RepID=A0A3S5AGE5_9PLAT|nr:unnamed protein product [Protopolystoma xenopodis]
MPDSWDMVCRPGGKVFIGTPQKSMTLDARSTASFGSTPKWHEFEWTARILPRRALFHRIPRSDFIPESAMQLGTVSSTIYRVFLWRHRD